MSEGHDADQYQAIALLAGIFNRLGDGKGEPVKVKMPKLAREAADRARAKFDRQMRDDDLDMMRTAWQRFGDRQAKRQEPPPATTLAGGGDGRA